MLEILSHKYLKKFLRDNKIDWDHIYSFGRIISQCIQSKQNYLINSEIFSTHKWYPALLIVLFLNEEDSFLVLTSKEIESIKKTEITLLKQFGFEFEIMNDKLIFSKHNIHLITLDKILQKFNSSGFSNKRVILTNVQNIKEDLRNILNISLAKKHWFQSNEIVDIENKEVQEKYNFLKQRFFLRAISQKEQVYLNNNDILILKEFFLENEFFSKEFAQVKDALFLDWACWVRLDYENFEWNLILEPVDELYEIKELLDINNFVFLSAFRRDNFFQKYLKRHNLLLDLVINFKSDFIEEKINIYIPKRQMLPNNPLFLESIQRQCNKLFLFRKKFTLILSNTNDVKINLATKLAAEYGQRILLESLPHNNYSILVASYDWWIQNKLDCQLPDQIIIPLLPIPDITDPINERTISYHFKDSQDWFREFLLLEALNKLDKAVSPLRKNSGSLVILDGRASQREWGRHLINKIKPAKIFNHMFPFE